MSSVQPLKHNVFPDAEEIIRLFEESSVQYEEELHRQSRLLEIISDPQTRPQTLRADEYVQNLIRLRVEKESLFSGKLFAAAAGWEAVMQEMGLTHLISPARAAKKWENLKKTYKELIRSPTGSGTEAGEPSAASWKWFSLMNEAIGSRPSVRPPYLIASSVVESPSTSAAPPPASVPQNLEQTGEEEEEEETEMAPSTKRPRRGGLITLLEKAERREEERARREEEREERLLSLLEKIVDKI